MTLRALADRYDIPIGEASQRTIPSTTIAFALDSGYIEPFKVMITSMIMTGTLLDCPVAIYSDDPKLLSDPAVATLADRAVLLEGERRKLLYGLAKKNVKRSARADWNRGTFLKWAVFEEQETEQLLFLDADMLCVRPLEPLLATKASEPFLCCPQMQMSIRNDDEGRKPPELIASALKQLLKGKFSGRHEWRINSGMMLIRKPLLNTVFFDKVTAHASMTKAKHEQEHLSNYFAEHGGRKMLPVTWNFQELFLYGISEEDRDLLADKVGIFHYAGKSKPWSRLPKLADRPSILVWHAYRTFAAPLSAKAPPVAT